METYIYLCQPVYMYVVINIIIIIIHKVFLILRLLVYFY
jgi:hypothetical protein